MRNAVSMVTMNKKLFNVQQLGSYFS